MKFFNKIISRCHLSDIACRIERCSCKKNTCAELNVNDALAILHSYSPDKGNSCIVNRELQLADCDIEVIVPCYNVERYVEECIDSILAQKTKYHFFVTIVNDGATDNTREIIRKYENLPNVRIIDQPNKGLSGARNTGIAQSHGKYLVFVHSDDVLMQGAIETFMELAESTGADVIDSGHLRFADRTRKGFKEMIMAIIYDASQHPQTLPLNLKSPWITGYPCGKALKKELFHMVQFPQGYWFEDTLIWMIIEPLCKCKVTTDELTFLYRMNPSSISHTAEGNPKSLDTLYITLRLLEDRERLGICFDAYQYDLLLQQMRNNYNRVRYLPLEIKQAVFVVQRELIAVRFAEWETTSHKVKSIETLLRNNDYAGFDVWCKWH